MKVNCLKVNRLKINFALYSFLPFVFACSTLPNPEVKSRIESITEDRLQAHVKSLTQLGPRPYKNVETTKAALDYISKILTDCGYQVIEEHFESDGGTRINLLAEKRGSEKPNQVFEICAHYDTVAAGPGADDNTSGVAGLLEIARVFKDFPCKKTVRFCFFAMEEAGLIGSQAHVKQLELKKDEIFEGLIDLEMIGYSVEQPDTQKVPVRIPLIVWPPRVGNFIAVVGNFSSGGIGNLFEDAADLYVPELPYYSLNRLGGFFGDAARSDHFPYWKSGRKAIMLTDTANFRNPNYHKKTDTLETLNLTFMKQVTMASAATVMEWTSER